jgi:hypothetical protein
VRFLDVAGNDEILVTVVAPASFDTHGVRVGSVIADAPILTNPDRKRVAVRVPVAHLPEAVVALRAAGAAIEHMYDY